MPDHKADLAYLTRDEDQYTLNLKLGTEFIRVQISLNQLRGIVQEGIKVLFDEWKTEERPR